MTLCVKAQRGLQGDCCSRFEELCFHVLVYVVNSIHVTYYHTGKAIKPRAIQGLTSLNKT